MLNLRITILLFVGAFSGTCLAYMGRSRPRPCTIPESNANLFFNKRGSYLFANCRGGSVLYGQRVIQCINGKWLDPKPVCAISGCVNKFTQPGNGQIIVKPDQAEIICSDSYVLAGNRIAYCNGASWDRPLGECRLKKTANKHGCDFETEDLCGWFSESVELHQWIRKIAINAFGSLYTGPTHDHTTMSANGGHYMLMESFKQEGLNVPLFSPIYARDLSLKTACCFRFYYFMYGLGVGDLSVYIKPASLLLDDVLDRDKYLKFKKSGTQDKAWLEEIFDIPEMQEDFQIVFVAKSSRHHLSDIAIDDVKLMIGSECGHTPVTSTENQETTEAIDAIYDVESCQNRCFTNSISTMEWRNNRLYLRCSCQIDCGPTCCPDYHTECLGSLFEMLNLPSLNSSTSTTTTTTLATTISSTTTTTPKPTTTIRTTTTSTTPKATSTTVTTTFPYIPTMTTPTTPKPTTTTKEIKRNITTSTTLKPTTTNLMPQQNLTGEIWLILGG